MANWYFYDRQGRKQGPFTDKQLRFFVTAKRVVPDTLMETDDGQKGTAGDIPGLFPVSAAVPTADSDHQAPRQPNPGAPALSGQRQAGMPAVQPSGIEGAYDLAQPAEIPAPPAAPQQESAGVFCTGCGAPFKRDMDRCPYCGSDTAKNTRFCHQCGTGLNPGQVVCFRCGAPVYMPDDGQSFSDFSLP